MFDGGAIMNDRIRKPTTTDAGFQSPAMTSLTVGSDGPILLQDHYPIEQMANFNRERIPERHPHAKGGGAFGRFQVTKDVSKYTKAAIFQPGTRRTCWCVFQPSPASAAAQTGGETRGGRVSTRFTPNPAKLKIIISRRCAQALRLY
jgi:catalase